MLDNETIEIPCPECGQKTEKVVAWIKAHEEFLCPGCGKPIHFEPNKLLKGMADAEEAIREFMWNPQKHR